jgi:hypothetical protein
LQYFYHDLVRKSSIPKKDSSLIELKIIIPSVFIEDFFSAALKHRVKIEVLLPPWYGEPLSLISSC